MVIDGWQVDFDKNLLRKSDSVISLRNKVMGVLVYLAENSHRLVSRDELINEIWHGNYPVGSKGLTNAIWQLRIDLQRICLEENNSQKESILTVPKKGYQLLLPVIADKGVQQNSLSAIPVDVVSSPDNTAKKPIALSRGRGVVVAVIFIMLISGLIGWFQQLGNKTTVTNVFNTGKPAMQLNLKGTPVGARLSPDGRYFVFNKTVDGQSDIYLREINDQPHRREKTERRITDHIDAETSVNFSSDGKQIAFVRGLGHARCGIYTLDIQESTSRLVTPCNNTQFSKVVWANNDRELLIFDKRPNQNVGGLYVLHLELSTRDLLPIPFSTRLYLEGEAELSPDGKNLAFVRSLAVNAQDIFLFNFANEQVSRITYDNARIEGFSWLQDNQTLVFSSSRAKGFTLWHQTIKDKLPTALSIKGKHPSHAKNANIGIYENVNGMQSIVTLELESNGSEFKPFIDSHNNTSEPVYSEKSNQINYVKYAQNNPQHWSWNFSNNTHIQHKFPDNLKDITHVVTSPNKDLVAFIAHSAENQFRHIYRMSIIDQQVTQISKDAGDHFAPSWSKDGMAIYAATAITGRWEIWSYPLDNSSPTQITSNGGGIMQYNQEQRFISKADRDGIWLLDNDNKDQLLIGSLKQRDWGNWFAASNGIYYVERDNMQDRIMFFDYQTQENKTLARYTSNTIVTGKNLIFNPHNKTLYFTVNLLNDINVIAVMDL